MFTKFYFLPEYLYILLLTQKGIQEGKTRSEISSTNETIAARSVGYLQSTLMSIPICRGGEIFARFVFLL